VPLGARHPDGTAQVVIVASDGLWDVIDSFTAVPGPRLPRGTSMGPSIEFMNLRIGLWQTNTIMENHHCNIINIHMVIDLIKGHCKEY
jgi:hypothetical protein